MIKYVLILFNFCLFADYYGGSPGSSFNYGTNAREISLSNSIISSYNKGFVAFNNPALLPKIKDNEYGFSYFLMSLDRSIQSISISRPLPPSAGVSLSFYRVGTNNIIQTSSFGSEEGSLESYQGFGMLSFGIDLGSLSAGFNFKALFNDMDIYKSKSSLGFDLGFLYEINKNINLGFKINNLSSSFDWEINYLNQNQPELYEEEIPLSYMVGLSYNKSNKLLFSTQIDYLSANDNLNLNNKFFNRYKVGVEYHLISNSFDFPILLRGGLNSINNNLECTLGFGMPIKINNSMILNIDYALDPGLVDEGISHLFSFSLLNY